MGGASPPCFPRGPVYLVATLRQNRVLVASQHMPGAHSLGYAEIRALLEDAFPGCVVLSPLDDAPADAVHVTAYLSTSRYGIGRSGGNFQEWAVLLPTPTTHRE